MVEKSYVCFSLFVMHNQSIILEIISTLSKNLPSLINSNSQPLDKLSLIELKNSWVKFIVGGQIKRQDPNLMLVYPEGNHIHMSNEQPYLQIGETKYGKPILDRMIHQDTPIGDAARVALLSLDSMMRSDLTVGPPIDLIVFKKDQINLDFQDQLKLDSPFFKELSEIWAEQIDKGVKKLPKFNWEN